MASFHPSLLLLLLLLLYYPHLPGKRNKI